MLVETGLVPGALLRNHKLKFICKQVYLRAENNNTDFTRKFSANQIIRVPVAHGEGNYFVTDDMVKQLEDNNQIAFRYTDANGNTGDLTNPNGSVANIAGVFNESKTIMGMMPHPEDAVVPHAGNHTGTPIFSSIVEALA
jgi:phosphoribosylformylglycinamidine synthase